ncbi:MAG: malto-oligosyltrehalose synthase, partial [Propionibacteriaceae bacterium]|nr:malto-oligosyltrehalose synthase [Propionibacteriaceae bacterium]
MSTADSTRRPALRHQVPVSTYRLQLGPDLRFDDVIDRLPYYAALGVGHLYLSPILTAAPGSTHGYDVVAHDEISPVLGGRVGFERLSTAAREHGLGLVLDIVPNHMAIPTPAWLNQQLWSVLAQGPDSPHANWFDVDWTPGAMLMPVLDDRLDAVLDRGGIELDFAHLDSGGKQPILRYGKYVFPVRAGTEDLPLGELLKLQHYRLADWRLANAELNYRRFFDVKTLIAIRVEDPQVFEATHDLICSLVRDGLADGLRVDHPDGLADPAAYLERLRDATGGAWVVAEKILSADETLAADWVCAGTTGYDSLWRVQQVFTDPAGAQNLGELMCELAGDTPAGYPPLAAGAKREILAGMLRAEVNRLTGLAAGICRDNPQLPDHNADSLRKCLVELLVGLDRYRAYVVPGRPTSPESIAALERAAEVARHEVGLEHIPTLNLLVELLLGRNVDSQTPADPRQADLMVRFGQTSAAVQAKGVEDTAFYRWTQLVGLCEVGADPTRFSLDPTGLMMWASQQARTFPQGMTTSSTHDTKRGEDVRARMSVLSEFSGQWRELVRELQEASAAYRDSQIEGRTVNMVWQTLATTWEDGPISADRLAAYLTKALREAKSRTTWDDPDTAYEDAVLTWAIQASTDPAVNKLLAAWQEHTASCVRATTLGQKLVQLTLPGVADTYQGTEVGVLTLVDPDNRRRVETDALANT